MKSAIAIRHLHFEDLGTLAPILEGAGYQARYVDICVEDLAALNPVESDLLIVLGGPIGAYQDDLYPTLKDELKLLEKRLAGQRPTLGICLGAQLMARALGARVYPTGGKEIGWGPVRLSAAGRESAFRHLGQDGVAVLHWHGDTFDLPRDATLLASTGFCRNQAYAWGPNAVGFQFHPEASGARLEQWFIGHACEIATAKLSVAELRADTSRYAASLEVQARRSFTEWFASIG